MRNFHFIKHLARSHQVWLVAYGGPEAASGMAALEALGIRVRAVPPPRSVNKRLIQLSCVLSGRSYLSRGVETPRLQRAVDELLGREGVDVVLLEGARLAIIDVRSGIPVVLDEHNIEYEVLKRTYLTERSPLRKAYAYLEYRNVRREELATWHRVDRCVFTSERERALATEQSGDTPSAVVPNGVDLDYFSPSLEAVDRDSLVFSGRMGYRPNTDAAVFFAREVLPLILRKRPRTVLTVVGAEPPREVRKLAGANVVVTGAVSDVRPYCRRAAVLLAPIRFGGGTRLKVLEAMAMAKPLVSTAVGCEGINAGSGEHLLVADSPIDMAAAVLRLLEDRDLATAIARRGLALVKSSYGWPLLAGQLEAVLLEVSERAHRRDPAVTTAVPDGA
jgi:glycosyltransferase involved in cell wall biosynthesis